MKAYDLPKKQFYFRNHVVLLFLGSMAIAVFHNADLLFYDASVYYDLNTLFCHSIFDTQSIMEEKMYVLAFDSIYIIILFHIFFGRFIEKEINSHGAYLFLRIRARDKWFTKKSIYLMVFSFLYIFMYLVVTLIICLISSKGILDGKTIQAFLFLSFSLTMLTFLSTLFINFIAIFYKEQLAFVFIYMILIFLVYFNIRLNSLSWFNSESILHYVNPVALMSLYSIESHIIPIVVIFFYLMLTAVIVFYMSKKISKMDISVQIK